MPLSKRDVALVDLYIAYRKAKVEAYYENTHVQALAFTEYEQNLEQNLARLHRALLENKESWSSDAPFLGNYAYLPKSIKADAWNNQDEGHFSSLDPIADWKHRFGSSGRRADAKLRLIIRPTVDFQVISALWIMKVAIYLMPPLILVIRMPIVCDEPGERLPMPWGNGASIFLLLDCLLLTFLPIDNGEKTAYLRWKPR